MCIWLHGERVNLSVGQNLDMQARKNIPTVKNGSSMTRILYFNSIDWKTFFSLLLDAICHRAMLWNIRPSTPQKKNVKSNRKTHQTQIKWWFRAPSVLSWILFEFDSVLILFPIQLARFQSATQSNCSVYYILEPRTQLRFFCCSWTVCPAHFISSSSKIHFAAAYLCF